MPAAAIRKKSAKQEQEDAQAKGLWIDAALILRLHGRRSSLSAPIIDGESQRLLHYADVMLGTEKKERFVAAKPTKNRKKL